MYIYSSCYLPCRPSRFCFVRQKPISRAFIHSFESYACAVAVHVCECDCLLSRIYCLLFILHIIVVRWSSFLADDVCSIDLQHFIAILKKKEKENRRSSELATICAHCARRQRRNGACTICVWMATVLFEIPIHSRTMRNRCICIQFNCHGIRFSIQTQSRDIIRSVCDKINSSNANGKEKQNVRETGGVETRRWKTYTPKGEWRCFMSSQLMRKCESKQHSIASCCESNRHRVADMAEIVRHGQSERKSIDSRIHFTKHKWQLNTTLFQFGSQFGKFPSDTDSIWSRCRQDSILCDDCKTNWMKS